MNINLLNKQQKILNNEIATLQSQLTEKEQLQSDKLNEVISQRNKIREEKEKVVAEEEQWRQGVIQSKTKDIIEKANTLKADSLKMQNNRSSLIPSENPLLMIKQIESKDNSYEVSCDKLLVEIKGLRLQTEKSFFIDKDQISHRKLSIAEKQNGKETPQSIKHTQYLISQSKQVYFEQYKDNRNTLLNAVKEELASEYDTILENITSLNNTDFTIDSSIDDMNITIGQYNGYKNNWPVVVDFTILNKRIEMEFGLSFEDFEQTKIPVIGVDGEYSPGFYSYMEQVEVLETYFADSESNPISIKLQYSITSDKESIHNYSINVNKMIVTRNDNNEQIIKTNLTSTDNLKHLAL